MQFTITSMLAATAGLATIASAAPLEVETSASAPICDAYPWFLIPHIHPSCTGAPAPIQPNPGPLALPPSAVYCGPLSAANEDPSFASIMVNRDACPGYTWTINLYTDAACETEPTVVTADGCVDGPGGVGFVKFDAIPNY